MRQLPARITHDLAHGMHQRPLNIRRLTQMAFQQHWNRFHKLVAQGNSLANFNETQRIAQMAYQWGREDAAVEQRIEEERRLAGQLNGGTTSEGQGT
jgi:hypothetical protein